MRILVTGVSGQLGYDVVKCLEKRKLECAGVGSSQFNLTDVKQMREYMAQYKPEAVIHCAAYTNVNQAETDRELCRKINVDGTAALAAICKEQNAKMMYISTDYVFPGVGENFYEPDDEKGAQCVYGQTKLEGESEVMRQLDEYFIVRISWVFGKNGNNFVKTMLRLGAERQRVQVVADQIGSPTYTADLAELLCDMIVTEKYGIYHASNEGICSWAEFAAEIFRQAQYTTEVVPISTEEYPTPAKRPLNSRMSKQCLTDAGFSRLPDWKDALARYLAELKMESQR